LFLYIRQHNTTQSNPTRQEQDNKMMPTRCQPNAEDTTIHALRVVVSCPLLM